jgi:hypothetical protein
MTSCSDNKDSSTVTVLETQEDKIEEVMDNIKNESSDIKETWEYKIYKL